MNLKKIISFLIVIAVLSVSCIRKANTPNFSNEAANDHYFVNEIYPWLYSIEEITDARISSAAANTLVIETIGEGRHRVFNSGVQGPVTISFSEFVLTKN